MKKIYLISILFFLFIQYSYNQFTCTIYEGGGKKSGDIINHTDFIPDHTTPVKYIRVNFHFMLLEESHPDYPGNFTSYDDGRGNPDFTAYDFVDDLLYWTNFRLGTNQHMTYPIGNSTPVIERKYRFILNGVFFHKDNTHYWHGSYPHLVYSENLGEAINVFFQSDGTTNSHGWANMSGDRFVEFSGKWDFYDYCMSTGTPWGNWANASGLMHEINHNLSLHHTIMDASGNCCDYCDDYCDDTPTRIQVKTVDYIDPCQSPRWNNPDHSNNIMEYAGYDAITPEQLGRVHWTIENEMFEYKPCYYPITNISITSFSENSSFIAKNIIVPSTSNIVIDDNKAMYINGEEVTINGTFEVKLGSQLIINTEPECSP